MTIAGSHSATVWVTIEKVAQQGFWLVLFVIMAPILGPRPYGQFALVMVFIGFCELILVEAVVEALLSLDQVSRRHLKTAVSVNTAAACLAAIVAWLGADLFDRLFDDAEIGALFKALALLPILSALTAGPISALRRRMAFRQLALRSILGLAAGGVAGTAVALDGYGVWALVVQVLVQRATELAVLGWSEPHAVAFGWSRDCWRDMARFVRNVVIGRSMYWASGQAPRLIVGYFLGPTELGLFTLASRAADAMIQVVVLPRTMVARIELIGDRGDPARFQARLQTMAVEVALIAFPIVFGAAAIIPQLFALVLDPRWQGAVLPTQLMLLIAVPLVGYFFCTAGLLAANRPDLEARIAFWQSGSNVLLTMAVASFGVTLTAAAMLLRLFAMLPLALATLGRAAGIDPWAPLRAILPILSASLAMGAAVYAIGTFVTLPGPSVVQPGLLVIIGVAIYVGAIFCVSPRLAGKLARRLIARARRRPVVQE
jgi:O-antigen/teichoic acid export membrane protein